MRSLTGGYCSSQEGEVGPREAQPVGRAADTAFPLGFLLPVTTWELLLMVSAVKKILKALLEVFRATGLATWSCSLQLVHMPAIKSRYQLFTFV